MGWSVIRASRRHLAFGFFLLPSAVVAIHCAGEQSRSSLQRSEVVAVPASASTRPVDTMVVEPPEQDGLAPIPPIRRATNEEKLAFLSSICRVATRELEGTLHVGCTTCAPFDGPDAAPDGTVTTDADPFYELEALTFGSFTSSGMEEAAATLAGCESHAENYGGTLLARRRDGKWEAVRYDSGFHPDQCITFRVRGGRDTLLCSWTDGHQSYFHTQILAYDFNGEDLERRWQEIVTIDDSSAAGCLGLPPGWKVESGRVEAFGLLDTQGDGSLELVVDVDHVAAFPNPAYEAMCKQLFESMEDEHREPVDPARALGPMKRHRLVYVDSGAGFEPTAITRRLWHGQPKLNDQ